MSSKDVVLHLYVSIDECNEFPQRIPIYYKTVTSYVDNYSFEKSCEYFFDAMWCFLLKHMDQSCIPVFIILTT